jgi:hypothetical protein
MNSTVGTITADAGASFIVSQVILLSIANW